MKTIEDMKAAGVSDGNLAADRAFARLLAADMAPAVAGRVRVDETRSLLEAAAAMNGRGNTVDGVEAYGNAREAEF